LTLQYNLYIMNNMLSPFQKKSLKIKTHTPIKKEERKPNIIRVFEFLCPEQTLKRSSRAHMTLCPFHGENNPSLALYEETNTYFCFSCEATGDSYTLIMKLEELDFKEALNFIEENNLR
jgi:hypothetical protein